MIHGASSHVHSVKGSGTLSDGLVEDVPCSRRLQTSMSLVTRIITHGCHTRAYVNTLSTFPYNLHNVPRDPTSPYVITITTS